VRSAISDLQGAPPPSTLSGRDCLTLGEFVPEEVSLILDEAQRIKTLQKSRIPSRPLRGRTLAMVFQKPSNRTRVSFEVGMYQLGGHALHLSPEEIQIGKRETPSDTGRVLARYIDAIMVRTFDHGDLEELAGAADVPVINGLSDTHHPCQALADLMTVREEFGMLEGTKIAYVGDGNNVAHSLAIACALTGAELTIAHPEGHGPEEEIVELADSLGAAPRLTEDPAEAVQDANAVYTDVWASMGQEAEAEDRKQEFAPYQVDEGLMDLAARDAIFLHCLPAHRGEEVTAEVIDGPRSRVFDQAENRLHAQKALLYLLMGRSCVMVIRALREAPQQRPNDCGTVV
jgi:ornithine carbamoyltransferase